MADEMMQDAVIRNLETVGEASRSIETRFPEFAELHTELPLITAYKMRNPIAHGYYIVDLGIVWRTVVHDRPDLQMKVKAALDGLSGAA